jgi:hypothetical protein
LTIALPLRTPSARLIVRQEKAVMMAKLAKFILFFYIFLMFKPVMPVFADTLAHIFWEHKHMIEVHEVHGKFHIHNDLAKAGHPADSERSNELKIQVEEYINVIPGIFKPVLSSQHLSSYLSYITPCTISLYTQVNYPPPKPATGNKISGAACYGSCFRAF